MTVFDSESLPPLTAPNAPPSPPEPLVRWIHEMVEVDRFDSEEGELLQVHCGGCLRRAYDLEITRFAWPNARGFNEWRRTNRVLVSRACPKCGAINRGDVTLAPGKPISDGLNGRWFCTTGCGASLAYVDAIRGRIKARCKRCERNVTISAYNAFFSNLKNVDDERTRRLLDEWDVPA